MFLHVDASTKNSSARVYLRKEMIIMNSLFSFNLIVIIIIDSLLKQPLVEQIGKDFQRISKLFN